MGVKKRVLDESTVLGEIHQAISEVHVFLTLT